MTDLPGNQSLEPPTSQGPTLRKQLTAVARIVISVGLLALMFWQFGLETILYELTTLDLATYAGGFAVWLLSLLARAIRWQAMLKPLGKTASVWRLFLLYMVGQFWSMFLPTGFGGDFVRAVELGRLIESYPKAATSVIAERMVGLFTTSLLALVVILVSPRLLPFYLLLPTVVVAMGLLGAGLVLQLDLLQWAEDRLPFTRRFTRMKSIREFDDALKAYSLGQIMLGMVISIPVTVLLVINNYQVGLAVDIRAPLTLYAVFVPVVSIIELVPISFNGIGAREFIYQLLFDQVGVPAGQAVAMALALSFQRVLSGLLGGLVSLGMGLNNLHAPKDDVSGQDSIIKQP